MLERLDVRDGHRVLEIGTGTGYNAALLSHRLGAASIYSVDLDVTLIERARQVLARLGVHPTLITADGYEGQAHEAPFDRILATCAISHVPPEWIRQLADGGRIVAPIAGNSSLPLLILDKTASDEVTGYFDTKSVGFMPLRHDVESPSGPARLPARPCGGWPTTARRPPIPVDCTTRVPT